ncbi:MAG: cofC [Sphingomonas bacterium]|uniref:2-phospho-L-lactate guanylyltransferase n=1 Tax=Sphingomonas bacterium TaxID=1895847 RepID=UPI00262F8C9F|nr:2-phospho-L-lactate guanylyltransferase [Sphingomonas bacterium]MDB5706600.1 cofC [Sphingomonas bacterium]
MTRHANAAIWAVIPVKPFDEGKSRLGLIGDARATTNRAFLDHVLGTALAVLPAGNVVVVSRDETALAVARRAGARGLYEPDEGDLNDALAIGAKFAGERGAAGVLSLFVDLPDLAPQDIRSMISEFTGDNLVIAPDEKGSGSNALLMVPNALPYRHGQDSLWRHLDAARETKTPFAIVRRPGLMRDVDTPAQYASIAERSARVYHED